MKEKIADVVMSKADKMFEKLGYEKSENKIKLYTNQLQTKIEYSKAFYSISFIVESELVLIDGTDRLTVDEHLAIHEKMKELGWLDE